MGDIDPEGNCVRGLLYVSKAFYWFRIGFIGLRYVLKQSVISLYLYEANAIHCIFM